MHALFGARTVRGHRELSVTMKMRSHRLVIVTVTLLAVLGVCGTAYAMYFSDRALPRTMVGGIPVSGMTRDEVAEVVRERFADVSVVVQSGISAPRRERLDDLGYTLDVEGTVGEVFAAQKTGASYATALVAPRSVDVVLHTDPSVLGALADELVEATGGRGSDATVRQVTGTRPFVVTPAVIGKAVVMQSLRDAVATAGTELRSTTATVQFVDNPPRVTTARAQSVADRANALVASKVTLSDGTNTHRASLVRKAAWVKIPYTDGVPGMPRVKAARVRAWVQSVAKDAMVEPVDGLRYVSSGGRVLRVVTQARAGRAVSNAKDVATAAVQALTRNTDYRGELSYRKVAATWANRTVAVGAEWLAYPAAPGEKWIDVNLGRHTITAYVGARVVKGPVPMVNGAPATPTAVGTFHVYSKNPLMTMRGFNADGTRYAVQNVPWSSFFYAGYALHGAPWRSSFGYSASHGCVNLPVGVAKWVYGWAPIGTPVVSHY
jgi:lipoprotein-anchoring transpeptidase ErfK/SrfK